jgi:hypothetical protein
MSAYSKLKFFKDVFTVLAAHQHPFILLENFALQWMGLAVLPNAVPLT